MTENTLDLDKARANRAEARSARREGAGDVLPVVFGGETIAELPAEFPMTVLEPLAELDETIAYILRAAAQMMAATEREQQVASMSLLVDVLAANPKLPAEIVAAVKAMGRRILGDSGYEAFCQMAPSPWDIGALAKGLMDWWGVSLGESPPSQQSSAESGATSRQISNGTTGSTRGGSGKTRAKRGL